MTLASWTGKLDSGRSGGGGSVGDSNMFVVYEEHTGCDAFAFRFTLLVLYNFVCIAHVPQKISFITHRLRRFGLSQSVILVPPKS